MDHEVLLPCFENSDLNQSSSSVGADQHGEVRLIGLCDPSRRVLDGMANIVIGDAVLSGTWQDLHTDNPSCRCACSQPSLRRYGETGAPSRHRPRVSASSHGQRDRRQADPTRKPGPSTTRMESSKASPARPSSGPNAALPLLKGLPMRSGTAKDATVQLGIDGPETGEENLAALPVVKQRPTGDVYQIRNDHFIIVRIMVGLSRGLRSTNRGDRSRRPRSSTRQRI